MKRRMTLASLLLGAALFSGALVAQTWHEAFYNVLVKGILFVGSGTPGVTQGAGDVYVGDGLEVDGAAQFDGTVTGNSTVTAAANVVLSGADFSFSAATGSTAASVSGSLGSDQYIVYFEPTANVSIMSVSSRSASGFTVDYQSASTTTVRGHIFHY